MKNFVILFCCALLTFQVTAQTTFTDDLDKLIAEGMLTAAEAKVDSALMINPGNVDALYYKGNIQYYKYGSYADLMKTGGTPDESVYTSDYIYIGQYKEILPKPIADTCAFFFSNALKVDPTRDDIRLALGYIYAISLQDNKLIDLLPSMTKVPAINDNSIRDYAYNFLDRGAYQQGMNVYEKISTLYPDNGNLLCDMAVEYYIIGDIQKAINIAKKCYTMPNLDTITYSNAFFLFSVAEQHEEAIACIQIWSDMIKNKTSLLYKGLYELLSNQSTAKKTINDYVQTELQASSEKDFAIYLLNNDLQINADKLDTIYYFGLTDAFSMLIYHHFYNKYPDAFLPGYNYAESLTYNKRYTDAAQVFSKINIAATSGHDIDEYHFYYAWALHQTGDYETANLHWLEAAKSTIPYIQGGANYFLGKYYYNKSDFVNARKYFLSGANASSESKYSAYCSDFLSILK